MGNQASGDAVPVVPGPLGRLAREPLVHFLVLASLLFLAEWIVQGDRREPIHIDWATQEFLVGQEADLRLRPLSEPEREAVIAAFVDDEILFREARRQGFENSSRVRRLLVQNMRFFLSGDTPEPSEDVLRAYFEDNREDFTRPATLTIRNIVFDGASSVPDDLLQRLRTGGTPEGLGDRTPFTEKRLYSMDERRIAGYFGPEGARRVLAIGDDDWHGPISTPRGLHFVKIVQRRPAGVASYEEARPWIAAEWQLATQRERVERALDEMRQRYRVILAGPSGNAGASPGE